MKTLKKDFKITGLMYLLVIICAGFSQGYVRGILIIPGDAVSTALNITTQDGLFRLGLVTDLIAFLLDVAISVMFYQLLKPAGKTLALISSAFRLLAHPAIGALNLLNHFMALHVLSGADFLGSFDPAQLQTMSLMFMDAHKYGYLLAGGFFGVHCLLLGILVYRSGMIPKIFGIMMAMAAMGYFLETFGDFLFPGNEEWLALVVGCSAALGEVGLTFYLLIKGVKKSYVEKLKTREI